MQENTANPVEAKSLGQVVLGLHRAIETMSSGERAQLKRMRAGEFEPAAFWRLVCGPLAPQFDGRSTPQREQSEACWAVVASAMARSGMPFNGKCTLGRAMAESGISELRFLRLLRADASQLPAQAQAVAQLLASKGQSTHWIDFARLIISVERTDRDATRRKIARDFFSSIQ